MPPAIIAAGVAGAGAIGSAAIGSSAAKKAAKAQTQAADQAAQTQWDIFNKQTELQEPFRQAGIQAQNKLMELIGLGPDTGSDYYGRYTTDFTPEDFLANKDPGYDFRFKEGLKALNNSMAARGLGISGANIKGAERYGQDYASNEYQNAFNRYQVNRSNQLNPLQSLAGGAQTSANTLTNAAANVGNNVSDLQTQAGNARASGYIGSANALSNGIGQGFNTFFGLQNLMNSGSPNSYGIYGSGNLY